MMTPGIPMLQCLDPDRIRSDLRALEDSLGQRASELMAAEMQMMRWSNVSSERFLSFFLDAANSLFYSFFRQTWIDEVIRFLELLRQRFGVASAPAPMQVYVCQDPLRILRTIIEIEGHIVAMQAIFNRMEPAYLADSARIAQVRGPQLLSPPPDDPGRGSRMLSAAEQIGFATTVALRQELDASLRLVREAIAQIPPMLTHVFQSVNRPIGFMAI